MYSLAGFFRSVRLVFGPNTQVPEVCQQKKTTTSGPKAPEVFCSRFIHICGQFPRVEDPRVANPPGGGGKDSNGCRQPGQRKSDAFPATARRFTGGPALGSLHPHVNAVLEMAVQAVFQDHSGGEAPAQAAPAMPPGRGRNVAGTNLCETHFCRKQAMFSALCGALIDLSPTQEGATGWVLSPEGIWPSNKPNS